MFRSLLLAIVTFVFVSCITARDAYFPDGSLGHHITCGGTLFSMGDCIQKAGDICGAGGYKIYDKNYEAIPFANSSGAVSGYSTSQGSAVNGGYHSSSGSFVSRDLFVKCNKEPMSSQQ